MNEIDGHLHFAQKYAGLLNSYNVKNRRKSLRKLQKHLSMANQFVGKRGLDIIYNFFSDRGRIYVTEIGKF